MRRVLGLSAIASLAVLLAGCGGSGASAPATVTGTRIVVGYVYVSSNTPPQASPSLIVANATQAPPGYVAPTQGTFNLHVDNGSITREAADMTLDLSTSNAIVARVTSKGVTPNLTFSASGVQLNGEPKGNIEPQVVNLAGPENTLFTLSYGVPSYTHGSPAAIKVLVADPNGSALFGAPGDIIPEVIPSENVLDVYWLAIVVSDANGVVIPDAPVAVTDPNSNPTENAVAESPLLIQVHGGGVEGVDVPITVKSGGLSTSFSTTYRYGTPSTGVFTTPGPVPLTWPAAGPPAVTTFDCTVRNPHGVPIPNLPLTYTRGDVALNGDGAALPNDYPAPAAGVMIPAGTPTTDANGVFHFAFATPFGAAGNPAFNSLHIKGGNYVQVRTGSATGPMIGKVYMTIDRPLGNLTIAGPSDVKISSTSPASGAGSFGVTAATDIDTQNVQTPSVTWQLTPHPAAPIGNTGDSAMSTDATAGSAFLGNVLTTGTSAGQMTVSAVKGTVTSNGIELKVLGLPQRVFLNPDTSTTGTMTANADCWYNSPPNTNLPGFLISVIDSGGNNLCNYPDAVTIDSRTIMNTSGTTYIGGTGALNNPVIIQAGATDGTFVIAVTGHAWNGTPFNMLRVVGVNVLP